MGKPDHRCPYCGFNADSKFALKRHKRLAHGITPIPPDVQPSDKGHKFVKG